jgi:hypothetical protein
MSITWSSLGPEGQRIAAQRFAEREAAELLLAEDAPRERAPGVADLYAWATDPEHSFGRAEREALLRDPALRRSFALLMQRVASVRVPAAAAASSGGLETRSGPGLRLQLIPSRADPAQVYVVMELDRDAEPVLLIVLRDGFPAARLPLPPSADGHVQLIEAADSAVVAALRDPTTELLLV